MTADIGSIKTKYNLNDADAYVVASASRTAGESPGIVVSFLNSMRHTIDSMHSHEGKVEVLVRALKNRRTGDILTKHLHIQGGGDDLRTKSIKVRKEKVLLDEKGRPIEDIYRWTPLYKKGKGEISTIERRVIDPRYYYFDVNGGFTATGHERPPVDDTQFNDYTDGIPYLEVKVIGRTSPKKNVQLFDPVSLESMGTGDRFGEKTLLLTVFYKDMMATEEITVPYQNNADGDIITGRNIIYPLIRSKLKPLYDGSEVQALYKYIKEGKDKIKRADQHPGIANFIDKVETPKVFIEYYGTHYKEDAEEKEERKRKRMKLLKRKIIINKKPVKKIKCTCPPLKKRKIITIKKKIINGRKRK